MVYFTIEVHIVVDKPYLSPNCKILYIKDSSLLFDYIGVMKFAYDANSKTIIYYALFCYICEVAPHYLSVTQLGIDHE